MANQTAWTVGLAALILTVTPAAAGSGVGSHAERSDPDVPTGPVPFFRNGDPFPGLPGLQGDPLTVHPRLGRDGGADGAAQPRGSEPDAAAPPPKAPTRAETLDRLLGRLAATRDEGEAKAIAGLIERLWMQSGSDTADLLMTRAVAAMDGQRRDVAAALLDKIIDLQPGWAEAWNKRATLRFLEDEDSGAMEDISHVLVLEPHHFGALSGMGFILERHGDHAGALKALRRALAVYPQDAEIRKAVDKLAPTVDGEDL